MDVVEFWPNMGRFAFKAGCLIAEWGKSDLIFWYVVNMCGWVFDTLYFPCTNGFVFQDFDTKFFLDNTYQNCWV
jgi:hypothetical protein